MGENSDKNGDSVLKVVQLFIDNINESTKSTVKELDKLGGQVENVKVKVNTPPRNEELAAQIKCVDTKLTSLDISIKTMIHTVRVVAAVLTIAVLLAGGIIHYSKSVESEGLNEAIQKIENCLDKVEKE
jgi:lipid II:glycine glycyltransferase (peptidoglycan interpeptide bridge formation enzyme)